MRRTPSGSLALRVLVTAAVLGWLVSGIDPGDAVTAVARIDLSAWGLIALVLAVDRGLSAGRWIALVRASGVRLPWKPGLRLYLVSSFVGSFLPAGIGGDVARTWELSRRTAQGREAVAAAAADRWLGLAAVAVLGAAGLAAWPDAVDPRAAFALHGLLLAALLGGVAGVFADRWVGRLLPAAWAGRRLSAGAARLASVAGQFRASWPGVAAAGAASLLLQTVRIALAWIIGRGMGIEAPLAYYFVVMPIGIVLILLPISIGGFGPAQGAIVWMFRPLQTPDALSFAMSTLFVVLGYAANLPGALLYLARR